MRRSLSFSSACLAELTLLVLALAWGKFFHQPLTIDWSWKDAVIGALTAIPPFVFFVWILHSKIPAFSHHRDLMEAVLRPWVGSWSILQLFLISFIAGISEEAFFRGAIQGSLAERVGVAWALILASGLFGAFHLLTWTYGVIATLIGAYLGILWIWTGNLLTPMITHGRFCGAGVFLEAIPFPMMACRSAQPRCASGT